LTIANNKLAQYEGKDTQASTTDSTNLDTKLFDRLQEFVKNYDGDNNDLIKMLSKISSQYGAFGEEKMKVLEKSFDGFLENIMSGANLKLAFYVAERPMPVKYKDFERYAKLKKYQRYEEYPDEYMREYLNTRVSSSNSREEFQNYNKNKNPIILKIKKRLKGGLTKLFEARDEIYKSLMQCDMLLNLAPGFCLGKDQLLQKLEELKYSNFMISYKEALDIDEKEEEVGEKIKLPNPKAFKSLMIHKKAFDDTLGVPKEFNKTFKYRKLLFSS